MNAFVDSNVLIDYLKGNVKAQAFLNKIFSDADYELCLGAIQRAEIIFFTRQNEEKAVLEVLGNFKSYSVSQEIVDLGAKIYKKWNPSHGIDINDALLAASVDIHGGVIFTLNTKHFPMKNLYVKKAY